jgi:4-hydroxy-tetrahydrodipicolinate reductase
MITICLAGPTGWVGRSLVKAIGQSDKFELVSAVGNTSAGQQLGELLGLPELHLTVSSNVSEALKTPCEVFIDYTHPSVVKQHVIDALQQRVAVIIGTSGLTEDDFDEIDKLARNKGVGVLAAGNFAITAVLLQRFAMVAARYVPHWEIIDFAGAQKPDSPSATARELAAKLAEVRSPQIDHPIEKTLGLREARGGTVMGSQVHSVRLPGYVFSFEVDFGLPNERLMLRHDAGSSAEPYVSGTLLAAEKVNSYVGLRRGLDSVLEL